MIPWNLRRIAESVHGRLDTSITGEEIPADEIVVTSVVTDSRDVQPGSLFVAIPGERVDGHDFAEQAFERGAVAVLGRRPLAGPTVVVDDPVMALGHLARDYREHLPDLTVIALTGSSGKTTTKDLLAQVLETSGPTVAPRGSYNSEVGVPLTIFDCDADTMYLVLEMGMRGRGHIDYLCSIGKPSIAAVINVGSAHLGLLGSREAIAEAKGEILDQLPPDGAAVLHADNALVMAQAHRSAAPVSTFGESLDADMRVMDLTLDSAARPSFHLAHEGDAAQVQLRLSGEHQAANAAAAAAIAAAAGLDLHDIATALSAAEPRSRWRMEVHERADGVVIINDAYNANPDSMRAALKALVDLADGRRTWAVLGEMGELGDDSIEEHDALGRLVVRLDVNKLLAVGAGTRPLFLAAGLEGSWGDEAHWVADPDEAIDFINREIRSGDVVLVKASRAVGLERVADALIEGAR